MEYLITWTYPNGLQKAHIKAIRSYLKDTPNVNQFYAVLETGEYGNPHVHAYVKTIKKVRTNNLNRQIKSACYLPEDIRAYKQLLTVKECISRLSCFCYLTKEDDYSVVCHNMADCLDEIQAAVTIELSKKAAKKKYLTDKIILSKLEFPFAFIEFSQSLGHDGTYNTYMVQRMMKSGYVVHHLFPQMKYLRIAIDMLASANWHDGDITENLLEGIPLKR